MKHLIIFCFVSLFSFKSIAQQSSASPYEWDWTRDGIWTGAALAGTAGGLLIISNKEGFTTAELAQLRTEIDDINFIDRWSAGNWSESANMTSDIPFYTSFAAPFALLLDKNAKNHSGQLFGLYIQSLATTSTLFTITAGLTNRARPYTYGTDAPLNRRQSTSATRSFFSGHVAATATATFFGAKVFQDFNPNSSAIPYVWASAAVLPAAVGYFRIEAGQHFLTDVLLGYSVGAIIGYLVPELHKRKDGSQISLTPIASRTYFGDDYQALSLSLKF